MLAYQYCGHRKSLGEISHIVVHGVLSAHLSYTIQVDREALFTFQVFVFHMNELKKRAIHVRLSNDTVRSS